jgi:hypothetical protein
MPVRKMAPARKSSAFSFDELQEIFISSSRTCPAQHTFAHQ